MSTTKIDSFSTATNARKPQLDFSIPSALVTFKVGAEPKSKDFCVHKDVVFHFSPALAAYFTGGLLSVEMPQYEVAIFGLLVHWLYTQEIRVPCLNSTNTTKYVLDTHLLPLTKLWNLAQQCDMPELQNAVMDHISPILDTINMADVSIFIRHIYKDVTTEGTSIRALARYHATHSLTPEILIHLADSAPRSLLFDMAMSLVKHNDLHHNSDRYELVDSPRFHVGIPEVDEELLDDEVSELECEYIEPMEEEEEETALYEHFTDEGIEIANQVMEMMEPCEEAFEKAEGNDIEEEDTVLESPMDQMINKNGDIMKVEGDNFGLLGEDILGFFD